MERSRTMATAPDPVSCFPVPGLEEMPDDIRDRMLAVQEKAGFVPNVFMLLARRPAEFRAFLAYHDALMDKREGLTAAEREMIVVAISAANQCQYCVVAHGAILRIRAKDPTISELVGSNWRKADNVTPKQKAMLGFALKVAQEAHLVSEADRKALRDAGFGEEEIWDIAAIAAFFSMSNRLANATELRPNREFHAMGRG
jgi:uncharacterized peroxidase-related enzyme